MPALAAETPTQADTSAQLLYALVPADVPLPDGVEGIRGAQLSIVREGGIGAIVSASPEGKLRPQRRHLRAYQQVLDELIGRVPTLPVAFGVVAENLDSVSRLIAAHNDQIVDRLDHVGCGVELSVSVRLANDNSFEFLLSREPDIKAHRDALLAIGGGTPDQQVEIGRQLEQALESLRAEAASIVETHLGDAAKDHAPLACRGPQELTRHAVLVDQIGVEQFEADLGKLASQFDENYAVNYDGPWPPFSFAKLQLTEPGAQ